MCKELPEVVVNCGKTNSFLGSEPRLIIFFHLGNETNGNFTQLKLDEERMGTTDSFVFASSTIENNPPRDVSTSDAQEGDLTSDGPEKFVPKLL